MTKDLQGRTALVTGASSGLGVDFCHELASRGADLVLVARREAELRKVADDVAQKHGVTTTVIPVDLSAVDAGERLHAETERLGLKVDVLVNNAGFGLFGTFLEIPWERERQMLELDIVTLVDLTKRYARDMVARGWGRVLLVSSIGAYQPSPTYATYSAAKSFVLMFGEAIAHELRGTGVTVTVLSPGVTKTAFLEVSGQEPTLYQRRMMMDSPTVVHIGVDAMMRGRRSVVPGFLNAFAAFSARLMPRWMSAAMAERTMREG